MNNDIHLTPLESVEKAKFDKDKITAWGKTDALEGKFTSWIAYEGKRVYVKETKEYLDNLLG